MTATLIIRRIDGSELFRDERDYRNFRELLSYMIGDADMLFDGCRAKAYQFEMLPYKATVHLRIYQGNAQRCGAYICEYYDRLLCLRYSLKGRQTWYSIV